MIQGGPEPRVAIAHDFMADYGGAERVTAEIARAFPTAPVSAILGRESVAARMQVADRFESLLPARARLLTSYRLLTPVWPAIVDRLRLPACDAVVSSSYAFAARLRSVNDAPRICYCWNPLRFAWSMTADYRDVWAGNRASAAAFDALAAAMRRSDRAAARKVDLYLAPIPPIAEEIERCYGVQPEMLEPPVDCTLFHPDHRPPDDFYLFCGRLIEPYKKVTMLVEAFNATPGERLVIAGDGPERKRLEAIAGPNIEFAGELSDDALVAAMQRCKAAVFPSKDDFGLVPVEVMACGRPVLAFAGGGALRTVSAGSTGEFFGAQTVPSLIDALQSFDPGRYTPETVRRHAEQWDSPQFHRRLREIVAGRVSS